MPNDWFEDQLKKTLNDANKLDQWMQIRRNDLESINETNDSSNCSTESENSISNDNNEEMDLR